jgi:hypothetical protein
MSGKLNLSSIVSDGYALHMLQYPKKKQLIYYDSDSDSDDYQTDDFDLSREIDKLNKSMSAEERGEIERRLSYSYSYGMDDDDDDDDEDDDDDDDIYGNNDLPPSDEQKDNTETQEAKYDDLPPSDEQIDSEVETSPMQENPSITVHATKTSPKGTPITVGQVTEIVASSSTEPEAAPAAQKPRKSVRVKVPSTKAVEAVPDTEPAQPASTDPWIRKISSKIANVSSRTPVHPSQFMSKHRAYIGVIDSAAKDVKETNAKEYKSLLTAQRHNMVSNLELLKKHNNDKYKDNKWDKSRKELTSMNFKDHTVDSTTKVSLVDFNKSINKAIKNVNNKIAKILAK